MAIEFLARALSGEKSRTLLRSGARYCATA
jgi:hypothetical protein